MTEAERLERVKYWWGAYGRRLLIAIAAAALAGYGWMKWQEKKEQDAERASAYYEAFLLSEMRQDKAALEAQAKHVLANFSGSPYALFTVLTLAKKAVESQKLDEAISHLERAVKMAEDTPLMHIAKIRLARVWLAKKEPNTALRILSEGEPGVYQPLYDEVKGDCYVQTGRLEEARRSYRMALAETSTRGAKDVILQMKLDSLGG